MVSKQTINAIENDKYDPTLQLAFDIASVLNTIIDELSSVVLLKSAKSSYISFHILERFLNLITVTPQQLRKHQFMLKQPLFKYSYELPSQKEKLSIASLFVIQL